MEMPKLDSVRFDLKPNAMSYYDVMNISDKISDDVKEQLVLAVDKDDVEINDALEHLGRQDVAEPITHIFGFRIRLVDVTMWCYKDKVIS